MRLADHYGRAITDAVGRPIIAAGYDLPPSPTVPPADGAGGVARLGPSEGLAETA